MTRNDYPGVVEIFAILVGTSFERREMGTARHEPSTVAGERQSLDEWLDYHRATLELKCEGLTAEQLRTPSVTPSDLTLLGLVRHMAEVERGWFQQIFADNGVPRIYNTDEDRQKAWTDLDDSEPDEVFAIWRAECDIARKISGAASLDDLAASPRSRNGEGFSLRWILTHMIEEYARHNGHADLLREAIDGATGD
jgi:hypothetical protein